MLRAAALPLTPSPPGKLAVIVWVFAEGQVLARDHAVIGRCRWCGLNPGHAGAVSCTKRT